jgi:hypothetical protein
MQAMEEDEGQASRAHHRRKAQAPGQSQEAPEVGIAKEQRLDWSAKG